ncbi:MAG: enoyl-CoA hydratase/isomerase family protein [Acidobacteria bacterium]|nr:enoyl-CoA hydratase/isomerase family protein [Acidobacteriota bacterium]
MPDIRYTVEPPLALVTLNRPERRNAISADMVTELTVAFQSAAADPRCRAVLLRSEGPAFCAGADLTHLRLLMEQSFESNLEDSRRLAALFDLVWSLPKPVVSAVQGPALGGGCGLAAICDFTIASEEATLGFPEVKIGFVPAIVSVFLVRLVGYAHARELLVTGRVRLAEEARQIGLVNRVVPAAELGAHARAVAERIAAGSLQAVAATKRLLGGVPPDELERAAVINAEARATADCREGVRAFLEKRPPAWS